MDLLKYTVMLDQETIATFRTQKDAETFLFAKFEQTADSIFSGIKTEIPDNVLRTTLDSICARFNIVTAE